MENQGINQAMQEYRTRLDIVFECMRFASMHSSNLEDLEEGTLRLINFVDNQTP